MEHSRHNILSAIHQSDEFFLINILSGNADILTPAEAQRYLSIEVSGDPEYIEKGYVVDPVEEERLYRRKYLDFLDIRDQDEIQLFYVPSYACNFNCSYCYQEGYGQGGFENDPAVTAEFFSYIRNNFQNKQKYITLFGGEPLLGGAGNRKFLTDFVRQCRENCIDLALVTNGYYLESYITLLSGTRIREIQVTLDGPEPVHNTRRQLKGGHETSHP